MNIQKAMGSGRRLLRPRILIAGAAALAFLLFWQPRFVLRLIAFFNPDGLFFVRTDQTLVALTIDDGPDAAGTPAILDVLEEHQVHELL